MKWYLLIVGIVVSAVVGIGVYFYVISRDIEPADFSDLALPVVEISPEENAYTYFMKAIEAQVSYTNKTGESISAAKYLRVEKNDTHSTLLAQVLADNEDVFQYVRQGVQCQYCIFPAPTAEELFPFSISDLAALITLFKNKISHEQTNGNVEVALQDAHTFLRYGQLIRQTPSCLVASFIGFTVESSGLQKIRQLAQDPQFSGHHLRHLLESVNATPPYDVSAQHTLKAEFHFGLVALDSIGILGFKKALGRPPPFNVPARFGPYLLRNQTQVETASYPRAVIPELSKFYSDMAYRGELLARHEIPTRFVFLHRNCIGKVLVNTLTPAYESFLTRRYQIDASLTATKIIIACHLFQRETGRKPQVLGELVPDYLPAVPPDPFDGQPFRYKPDEGIIYSVGPRLKDLDGASRSPESSRLDGNVAFKIWE